METNLFITVLSFIAVLLVVFLILREVVCWYWKINERITLQQQSVALLKKLVDKEFPVVTVPVAGKETVSGFCTNCGKQNVPGTEYCSECLRKLPVEMQVE